MKHHIVGTPESYVIIDKAALERGEPAVQFVGPHQYGTRRVNFQRIEFRTPVTIEQLPSPQQDGTRVRITNLGLMEVFA